MRRYLIPFAVGLILGIGTVPAWTGARHSAVGPAHAATMIVPHLKF